MSVEPAALHSARSQGYQDRRWGKPKTAIALFLEQRCGRYEGDELEALAHQWLTGWAECDLLLAERERGTPLYRRQR